MTRYQHYRQGWELDWDDDRPPTFRNVILLAWTVGTAYARHLLRARRANR